MGQLHLNSSISELRYLTSKTIFSYSALAGRVTRFMKVFLFRCTSSITDEITSYCSRMSSNLFNLSCKRIGTLLARCFSKTASGLRGRCDDEFIFSTSKIDVA